MYVGELIERVFTIIKCIIRGLNGYIEAIQIKPCIRPHHNDCVYELIFL